MKAKDFIAKVTAMALPVCEANGLDLWDVTFEKEGASYVLTVFIDKDAILHGKLEIVNVEGVTLCGFGAICSERYERYDEKFHHAILLDNCRDIELRDL